jgi:hypothetical protein
MPYIGKMELSKYILEEVQELKFLVDLLKSLRPWILTIKKFTKDFFLKTEHFCHKFFKIPSGSLNFQFKSFIQSKILHTSKIEKRNIMSNICWNGNVLLTYYYSLLIKNLLT